MVRTCLPTLGLISLLAGSTSVPQRATSADLADKLHTLVMRYGTESLTYSNNASVQRHYLANFSHYGDFTYISATVGITFGKTQKSLVLSFVRNNEITHWYDGLSLSNIPPPFDGCLDMIIVETGMERICTAHSENSPLFTTPRREFLLQLHEPSFEEQEQYQHFLTTYIQQIEEKKGISF